MRLITLGSGSSGNCYVLTNGTEALILDAGLPFMAVKIALKFQTRQIKGVIVTHRHGDHASYIGDYAGTGIPVWTPYMAESLRQKQTFGRFKVASFECIHDVPCVGYLIEHPDIGRMLYATDTEYVKYRFKGLQTMLIEANYSDELANRREAKYRHVLTGHMSIGTALDCIAANATDALRNVILCHLSGDSADPVAFKLAAEEVAPENARVSIAEPGTVVDLRDVPF